MNDLKLQKQHEDKVAAENLRQQRLAAEQKNRKLL